MSKTFRAKVAAKRQITLPEEMLKMLRVGEGDTVEFCVEEGRISWGYGLKLVPTSLFEDGELMERLRQRELEIAHSGGVTKSLAELRETIESPVPA